MILSLKVNLGLEQLTRIFPSFPEVAVCGDFAASQPLLVVFSSFSLLLSPICRSPWKKTEKKLISADVVVFVCARRALLFFETDSFLTTLCCFMSCFSWFHYFFQLFKTLTKCLFTECWLCCQLCPNFFAAGFFCSLKPANKTYCFPVEKMYYF